MFLDETECRLHATRAGFFWFKRVLLCDFPFGLVYQYIFMLHGINVQEIGRQQLIGFIGN